MQIIDGFQCYDQELANSNDDFESRCFPVYQKYIPVNFWYKGRNKIINLFLNKFRSSSHKTFLEIGCGNGFTLKYLKKKNLRINFKGCDIYIQALQYAKINNDSDIELFQYNLFKKNLTSQYDVIGCFDVLEHIKEDEKAIENIYELLSPGGICIITVPSDMNLWSNNDIINKHKRRYSKKELTKKIEAAQFELLYMNHFVFFLYPILFIKAKLQGKIKSEKELEGKELSSLLNLEIPKPVNFLFGILMQIEYVLVKIGFKFPWGSSLICVLRKNS